MFIGACSNANGQVNPLPITPVYALGKLQQAHARGMHQIAGLWRAMGDGDALAKER